jgi:hypothetical protein
VPVYAGYLLYVGTYLPPQHARTTATFTVLSFVAGSKSRGSISVELERGLVEDLEGEAVCVCVFVCVCVPVVCGWERVQGQHQEH